MPDVASTPRFSLGSALSESLRYAVPGIGHVFKITWLVILAFIAAIVVLSVLFSAIFGLEEIVRTEQYSGGKVAFEIINFIIGFLFGAALLVIIARDYLLQEQPVRLLPVLWPVALRYFLLTLMVLAGLILYFIVVTIAGIALGSVLGPNAVTLIGIPVIALSVVGFAYLVCRIITWVIARAVDHPQTLGQAWRSTAGATGWKVFGGLVLLALITAAALFVFVLLAGLTAYAVDRVSIALAIPLGLGLLAALIVIYMMFFALFTVYQANILKQTVEG
jgi:hypothetical protein